MTITMSRRSLTLRCTWTGDARPHMKLIDLLRGFERYGLVTTVVGKHQGITKDFSRLLQLRVLRFGLFQNGDVRIGIVPQREEVVVLFAGDALVTHHDLRSGELQQG
jgi:hypothetical protein